MCRMSITSSIRGRSAMVLSSRGRDMIWELASSVLVRSAVQSRTLEAQPAYCGSCGVSKQQRARIFRSNLGIHMSGAFLELASLLSCTRCAHTLRTLVHNRICNRICIDLVIYTIYPNLRDTVSLADYSPKLWPYARCADRTMALRARI